MEMMSQNIGNIALAMSKLQGTVGLIPKSKTAIVPMKSGGQFKYSYADLADIWDAIRNSLMQNELAVSQFFCNEGSKEFLTTIVVHSSGEWIKSILELSQHEKIQEMGSEITYLRRYALSSILGIAADEDEDGQMANNSLKKGKKEAYKPMPITPKDLPEIPITEAQCSEIDTMMAKIIRKDFHQDKLREMLGINAVDDVFQKDFQRVVEYLNKVLLIQSKQEAENVSA